MNKAFVDEMISNMRKADFIAKASPWMVEGIGDKGMNPDKVGMNVRYVGIKLNDDWAEVFSKANNVLVKFVIDRSNSYMELYLANTPPFFRIITKPFTQSDKWENLLGEIRRILKKDKADYLNHQEKVGNLYVRMKPHLK